MPSKSSQRRAVSFVHLSCAALFGVDSELAEAWPSNSLPEQGVEPGWQILVLKPDGRDDFKKHMALVQSSFSAPGAKELLRKQKAAILAQERLPRLLGDGELRPGDSDEMLRLYCTKCCIWISIPSRRLADHAERHPGPEGDGVLLLAYVTDRGEVLYWRDAHAEELVRRDRRARHQPPSAPIGALKRSDTWTPVRTTPKER
jgi:hypothetical protein